MEKLADCWGIAITVPAVDLIPSVEDASGDADRQTLEIIAYVAADKLRETTQTVDRFLAEAYATRVSQAFQTFLYVHRDESVRAGAELSICVKELGPNLPHRLPVNAARKLVAELDTCIAEVKRREAAGRRLFG